MTIREALLNSAHRLELKRIPNSRLGAEVLLSHCLGVSRAFLYTHDDRRISEHEASRLETAIDARGSGVPLQYIVGHQEFYGRDFIVNPSVLIPRPETEYIIEAVLERRPSSGCRIIDVGTGSGCIAVTLALELPGSIVYAVDISEAALTVAKQNAAHLAASVSFAASDLLDAVCDTFDFIVSNPPYIRRSELQQLQPEVRDHEPHVALFPTGEVEETYQRLIHNSFRLLKSGAALIMEIGFGMAEAILPMLGEDWIRLPTKADLQGIPRTVIAIRR